MLTEEEEKIRLQLVKIVKHLSCSICLNLMINPSMTQCLHRFCNLCICQSIQSSDGIYCRCPLCNEKITKRSLREQSELSLIIKSVKRVVQLFENDNQLTSIMGSDDNVVFDASTDKSRSSDDSVFEEILIIDEKDMSNESNTEDKCPQVCEEINISKDIESNRKSSLPTTSIVISDDCWPTCEDSSHESNYNETKDITDINISTHNISVNCNDCSFKDRSIKGLNKLETDESTEIIDEDYNQSNAQESDQRSKSVLDKSPNVGVSKSTITYKTISKSADDKFDEIIAKVNNYNISTKVSDYENTLTQTKNQMGVKPFVKPVSIENVVNNRKPKVYGKEYVSDDSEDECVDTFYPTVKAKNIEHSQRKPLTQLKRLQINEKQDVKKKFKRVQRLDSSDEDTDSPVIVNRKTKVQQIRESEYFENKSTELEIPESDMSDDDLLMTSIHAKKNDSIEMNRTNASFESNKRDGYGSDTQLITSSPTYDFD